MLNIDVDYMDDVEASRMRYQGMLEDVREAQTVAELNLLAVLRDEYPEVFDDAVMAEIQERRAYLSEFDPISKLRQLEEQLRDLRSMDPKPVTQIVRQVEVARPRSSRSYRLVKVGVDWSNKPQVHAVMEVLKSMMRVGDVRTECEIIEAMERNGELLGTKQPPARIWHYYKGNSADGLLAHGNIEKA